MGGTRSGVPHVEGVGLADEGEVVVAAGGVRDPRATVDRDTERGRVQAVAAVDLWIHGNEGGRVADANGVADVAATVDVASGHGAAVRRGGRHATVPSGGDELGGGLRHSGDTQHCSGYCRIYTTIHN